MQEPEQGLEQEPVQGLEQVQELELVLEPEPEQEPEQELVLGLEQVLVLEKIAAVIVRLELMGVIAVAAQQCGQALVAGYRRAAMEAVCLM